MPSALVFSQPNQNAAEALRIREFAESQPQRNEVLVEFLAAPVNPLDLMVVAGKYHASPKYHIEDDAIAGFDGVARVLDVGSDVTSLQPGDMVVPNALGIGTWRTRAVLEATSLLAIPEISDTIFAALLKTGVLPAYLLIEDMRRLKPGDWIIQNAGTGVIPQMVVQLAHLRGVKTISVVRDRAEVDLPALQEADLVLQESELLESGALKDKRIVLGLDCVFGSAAVKLANCLSSHGTFVNYGQLSGGGPSASMTVQHRLLFFDRLTFRSFRGTEQLSTRSSAEISDLCGWLAQLVEQGILKRPAVNVVPWVERVESLQHRIHSVLGEVQDTSTVGRRKTVFKFEV